MGEGSISLGDGLKRNQPMEMMDYYCPDCRARLRLDRGRWVGRALRCPDCASMFRVPTDGSDCLVHAPGAMPAATPGARARGGTVTLDDPPSGRRTGGGDARGS